MSALVVIQWVLLIAILPAVGYIIVTRKRSRVHFAYAILVLSGYLWAFGQHLENTVLLYFHNEAALRASVGLSYVGICMTGASGIYVAWCYAGKHRYYRNKIMLALLFGTGLVFFVIIITNDFHHLYYIRLAITERIYGPLFYVFTVYTYICVTYAFVVLRTTKWSVEERATEMYFFGFAPMMIMNLLNILLHNPALDLMPAAYSVMLVAGYMVIWRHKPISLVPMVAEQIFNEMSHPVIILDAQGRERYRNDGAEWMTPPYRDIVHGGDGRTYSLSRTKLESGNQMLLYTDITLHIEASNALSTQQSALHALQRMVDAQAAQIEKQAQTAEELQSMRRRMRMMETMNAQVRTRLREIWLNTNAVVEQPAEEKIQHGRQLTARALDMVRSIVRSVKKPQVDGME